MFTKLIENQLHKATNDPIRLEAVFFLLKSVELAIKDETYPSSFEFLQLFYKNLLSSSAELIAQDKNVVLQKGFCNLVSEMASFFSQMPQHFNTTLRLVVSTRGSISALKNLNNPEVKDLMDSLEKLYVKTVMELCQACPQFFTLSEFQILKDHLNQNASEMSVTNLSLYVESVCYVCSKQPSVEQIK